MRTQRLAALAVALLVGSFVSQARATALPPGGSGVVPNAQADPLASGTVLASIVNAPYTATSAAATYSGNYDVYVIQDYADNPFGPGALTFVYRIDVDSGSSVTAVQSSTRANFAGFLVDVGYFQVAASDAIPGNASRSSSGASVKFDYLGANDVAVGERDAYEIINTNAVAFQTGAYTLQDGATVNLDAFAPSPKTRSVSPTPEPATLAMVFTALPILGLGYLRRRRRDA